MPSRGRRDPDRQCYGNQVDGRLEDLLPEGTTVYLMKDEQVKDPAGERDPFRDEDLYYVWFKGEDDGKYYLLNELLVREGSAVASPKLPNLRYAGALRRAQQLAMAEGKGLWSACQS